MQMTASESPSLVFLVEPDLDAGVFVASWDDSAGGGITTQAQTISGLAGAIKEAVACHFVEGTAPQRVALHFVEAGLELA